MNKFRIGLGVFILLLIASFLIGQISNIILKSETKFSDYVFASVIITFVGGIIYGVVQLLKWCFKPLER